MTDSNGGGEGCCSVQLVLRDSLRALLGSFGNYRVAITSSAHGFMALLLQGLLGCSPSHQKNQGWLQQPARLATDRHASQGQLERLSV